jgi:ferric-dicitrate binding protein FerR (iron transport regulator)
VSEQEKDFFDGLTVSFLSRGTTPEEEKMLLEWIESDADNGKYYRELYMAWLSSAQNGKLSPGREESALNRVHKKVFEVSIAEKRLQIREARKAGFKKHFRYAAAVAILIVATYMVTHYFSDQKSNLQISEMTYEAHYGSRAYAVLSDGSKVWLNSGSKLVIMQGYNVLDREVKLTGEAFFDVETNAAKPFIVKAGELSIKATGTSFNVKAYPEERLVTTTLVEGTVFIEGLSGHGEKIELKINPSQSVSYPRPVKAVADEKKKDGTTGLANDVQIEETSVPQASPTIVNHANTDALISWMRERWVIDNEDFGSLAIQLERRYNVNIRFESEKLKAYRFTGTIERETVEQMFEAFRYSIPLKYTIDKGIVTIALDRKLEKIYERAWKQ